MTLSCSEISDLLDDFLLDAGADNPALPETLQAHLADCHACQHNWQAQQAFHQSMVSAVQSLPEPSALSENFVELLEARIQKEAAPKQPKQKTQSLWQTFSSPAARSSIAAGVLLLVFASTVVQNNLQNQLPQPLSTGETIQQPQIATGLKGVGPQTQQPSGSGSAESAGTGSALSTTTSFWDELEAEVSVDDDPLAQIVGF